MPSHKIVDLIARAQKLAGPRRVDALQRIEDLVGRVAYRKYLSRYESGMWFAAQGTQRPQREEFGGPGNLLGMG